MCHHCPTGLWLDPTYTHTSLWPRVWFALVEWTAMVPAPEDANPSLPLWHSETLCEKHGRLHSIDASEFILPYSPTPHSSAVLSTSTASSATTTATGARAAAASPPTPPTLPPSFFSSYCLNSPLFLSQSLSSPTQCIHQQASNMYIYSTVNTGYSNIVGTENFQVIGYGHTCSLPKAKSIRVLFCLFKSWTSERVLRIMLSWGFPWVSVLLHILEWLIREIYSRSTLS